MTISPSTQELLQVLSLWGWIWIIPIVERLSPLNGQKFIRPGMINDLIHTYHRVHLWSFLNAIFVAWLAAYAQRHAGQGPFLQGSLQGVHWLAGILAILMMDHIVFYVAHYLSHKVPLLWQFHRVHHSSQSLDSFSTSRFHIIDKTVFAAPFLLLVSYFQPDPVMVFLYFSFHDFWGRYGHGNIKDPHWVGYFMSNPKFHRWHHCNEPEAIDKNFSAVFNFFDYLFGTAYYPKNKIPQSYGEDAYPNNILVQHYRPFIDCYKIVKNQGWMALLRKPRSSAKKLEMAHD